MGGIVGFFLLIKLISIFNSLLLVSSQHFSLFSSQSLSFFIFYIAALGSKALQKARNWQPAKPHTDVTSSLDRNLSTTTKAGPSSSGTLSAPEGSSAAVTPSEEGASLHDDASDSSKNNHGHKVNITHPGYFSPTPGPVYTPAPPEALAAIRK